MIFEKENINTLTESSEFLITLFSGFAQAESESQRENDIRGKQFSMREGIVHFQYKKLLGYRRGEDGQPEIVPEEAEMVRRIYRRYLEGASEGEIKKELEADNVPSAGGLQGWSHRVVHSILTNEKYMGDALLQKTFVTDCISKRVVKNNGELPMYYIENNYEGIIPRELFQRVQEEMARRTSKRDEDKLHSAIVAALNQYGASRASVIEDALELVGAVQSRGGQDGMSLLALQDRLKELSEEQSVLLDRVLEDMDNSELNAQLKALAEEKQGVLDQITAYQQDEEQQALQASRQRERDEWLEQQDLKFTVYDDIITRRFVETITVVDAETIRIKIQDADVEIEQSLC